MVEIFKTNVDGQGSAERILKELRLAMPAAHVNFDLDDRENVLRVEDAVVAIPSVIAIVTSHGFLCKQIPDEICNTVAHMKEFWDTSFTSHQAMWGADPANAALVCRDLFVAAGIKDVLIPGIGYGRNARVFTEKGMQVTGIEISPAAIAMAESYHLTGVKIIQGSVTDMPLDDHQYDGIFCYGLLYLLTPVQRQQMLRAAYSQLLPGGMMVFSVISKNSASYGKGKQLAKDTFEVGEGGQVFFYDETTVREEFAEYGLTNFKEIGEQADQFTFYFVQCVKM